MSDTAIVRKYESGSVVKWETKAFAQTAVHPAGNRVVYSIKVGDLIYQVARRSASIEMTTGEKTQSRVKRTN